MTKYKLSKNIAVYGIDDTDPEDVPPPYRQGFFILLNKTKNREYLINETVRYFIDKFSLPRTYEDVVAEVAGDVQSGPEAVRSTCAAFVQFLRKKRILVPEKEKENEVAAEALYSPGDSIGRYHVDGVLVNKRNIDIYTATDTASGCRCVIKLLNRKKIPDARRYAKEAGYLEREFALLQKTAGAGCVSRAYAFEKDRHGQAFIVLELISGTPVVRFVNETPGLTWPDVLVVLQNVLDAFAKLHTSGTVHGDVHSGNVLVADDKSVKLIDLGLSINPSIEEKQVVKYGGVDFYMPPERINTTSVKKFARVPDCASDVYQIGLLLYAALYNGFPFTGFVWEDLSKAIKEGRIDYPALSATGYPVPESLGELMRRCLQTAPEKRFRNAAEIHSAFVRKVLNLKSLHATHAQIG